MRARHIPALALMLIVPLLLGFQPQQTAKATDKIVGGIVIHSVLPRKICVGDKLTINGGTSIGNMDEPIPPIAWLPVTQVDIAAQIGKVSPEQIIQYNDGFYFSFTYTATQPGSENLVLTVNHGVAMTQERFEVEEKCDYDAFVTTTMNFTADLGDELFQSITHVNGMGTMKRDRQGSEFYQGDGNWHLEEKILSKPSICVEYYAPPLQMNGPFELDGHLVGEGETVDVILSFLPKRGARFYHGETTCVDESGETGYGHGIADMNSADPSLASTIEATFLAGGGTQSVELKGGGMAIVQSVGTLDYTATLTLIPR